MNGNRNKIVQEKKHYCSPQKLPTIDNTCPLPLPHHPTAPSSSEALPSHSLWFIKDWWHPCAPSTTLTRLEGTPSLKRLLSLHPGNDVRWYRATYMSWPYPLLTTALLRKINSVLAGTRTPPCRKRLKHEYACLPNRRVNQLTWFLDGKFVCVLTSMYACVSVII